MGALVIVVFIIFAVIMFIVQGESHKRKITEEVNSMGGQVINIERKTFDRGPFVIVGKGKTIYRFEYSIDNEIKEGWVRFGSIFGPDWKL